MNRKLRRNLMRKGGAEAFVNATYDEMHAAVSNQAVSAMAVFSCAVLHDKFGFGEARLMRFMREVAEKAACVDAGTVTLNDIQYDLIETYPILEKELKEPV